MTIQARDAGIDGPVMYATTNVTVSVVRGVFPPTLPSYNFSVPELSPAGEVASIASLVAAWRAELYASPQSPPLLEGTFVGNLTGYSLNDYMNLSYTIAPAVYYAVFPFTGACESGRVWCIRVSNRPAAFAVISVPGPGGSVIGAVYTTAAGTTALSFNQGPQAYFSTATVLNNNPQTPMSAFSSVVINVTWVPKPPYFNAATQAPGSAWFQLEVNELSTVGTPVTPAQGSGAILGYSKDTWAGPLLRYAWASQPAGCSGCFVINATTGAVTLSASASLNFLVAKSYNFTVSVTDTDPNVGMSDTAAVTVWVREVNKPSVWAGLFNATTRSPMAAVVMSEATAVGSAVGRVNFSDPNTAFPWNVRNYALIQQGVGAPFFALDAVSGVLSVAAPGLSYWDTPTFTLNVSCTDSDQVAPLTTVATITVVLTQVNSVAITSFSLVRGWRKSASIARAGSGVTRTVLCAAQHDAPCGRPDAALWNRRRQDERRHRRRDRRRGLRADAPQPRGRPCWSSRRLGVVWTPRGADRVRGVELCRLCP